MLAPDLFDVPLGFGEVVLRVEEHDVALRGRAAGDRIEGVGKHNDARRQGNFGASLAISGDTAIIGAPQQITDGLLSGALETLDELFGFSHAMVLLPEEPGGLVTRVALVGDGADPGQAALSSDRVEERLDLGLFGAPWGVDLGAAQELRAGQPRGDRAAGGQVLQQLARDLALQLRHARIRHRLRRLHPQLQLPGVLRGKQALGNPDVHEHREHQRAQRHQQGHALARQHPHERPVVLRDHALEAPGLEQRLQHARRHDEVPDPVRGPHGEVAEGHGQAGSI